MKQILLMIALVALVGCSQTVEIADPIVEEAVRWTLQKPTGKLTKADLDKVTQLDLSYNKSIRNGDGGIPKGLEKLPNLTWLDLSINSLTSVKGLEKLTKLKMLNLYQNRLADVEGLEKLTQLEELLLGNNPDPASSIAGLTKAQITELQKALPKCKISSNLLE